MDNYHIILNVVLMSKIILVTALVLIMTHKGIFKDLSKCRWGLILGSTIYILGHLADLVDGSSDLHELQYYALARHFGALTVLITIAAMNWCLIKRSLLVGSVFERFINIDEDCDKKIR